MKNKHKISVLFTAFIFSIQIVVAQTVKEHYIQSTISDYITNVPLDFLTSVELFASDSVTFVSTGRVFQPREKKKKLAFHLPVPKPGDYVVRCKNEKYHTLLQPVTVKFYKREAYIQIEPLRMKRKLVNDSISLDELVVTATKLKFYFDNDTLVYNAEAFVTQEGFVLNNILQKMPGLEIKDNGDIYSNGRQVQTLLLNGKDFFNKDRSTLLDNLPAYMVKNVKIYDKTVDSTAVIKRERELSGLTMDIRLKKDYAKSVLGNLDAGLGTEWRYYGKLFGLSYSDIHRLSMYAMTNDINKNETMLQNGSSRDMDHGVGLRKNTKAGLNYNVDNSQGKYYLDGSLQAQYVDENFDTKTNTQYFLAAGDRYSRSVKDQNSYKVNLNTSHNFYVNGNTPYDFTVRPYFNYDRTRTNVDLVGGSFNTDIDSLLVGAWVDSLRKNRLNDFMKLYGLNKQHNMTKSTVSNMVSSLTVDKQMKIPHTDDVFTIKLWGEYQNVTNKNYEFFNIGYVQNGSMLSDIRNKYVDNAVKKWSFDANTSYLAQLSKKNSIEATYKYCNRYVDENAPKYLLHEIGSSWSEETSFGSLPSDDALSSVMDMGDSFSYIQKESSHYGQLKYQYFSSGGRDIPEVKFFVAIPIIFENKDMRFLMDSKEQRIKRNNYLPAFSVEFYRKDFDYDKGLYYTASYNMFQSMPSMMNLVDRTSDYNPLYVTHGNPNLKNTTTHSLNVSLFKQNVMDYHTLGVTYSLYSNTVSQSIIYDLSKGNMDVTPVNVNGNNHFEVILYNHWYTKKNKTGLLGSELRMDINNSSEYIGSTVDEANEKSVVKNLNVNEKVSYQKSYAKSRFTFAGYLTYNHTTSDRESFNTINSFDFGFDVTGNIELPKNYSLSTNVKSVSRRGYNYGDMNDDEIIWNASLSKTFGKHITLKLDANDILAQRKSVYRYVNAQGRTEIFNNNLKRYSMLHFIWRFDAPHAHRH